MQSNLDIIDQQIKDLNTKRGILEEEQRKLKNVRMASVKRQWRFSFLPAAQSSMMDTLHDDKAKWYVLSGEIINRQEMLNAGHSEDSLRGGSYKYLYHASTHKIVCGAGGGTLYINDGRFSRHGADDNNKEAKEDCQSTFDMLGEFVHTNPDGGYVTAIIVSQRHFGW